MTKGLVPGGPFGRVIEEWLSNQPPVIAEPGSILVAPLQYLASETKMNVETLRKIKNGQKDWITFDVADKIVTICCGWGANKEIHDIYQSFDLKWLDRKRPCAA